MVSKFFRVFIVLIYFMTALNAYGLENLPKHGDIAVLVEGPEEHVRRVETFIIKTLRSKGYRVVDEAKMKKIRKAAAQALADKYILYGEKHRLFSINSKYSVAATIMASITPEQSRENSFKLFTATASATVTAILPNGVKLGGETSASKQVGYTEGEAMRKAVDESIKNSLNQIL